MKKLNIGFGDCPIDGYINIDDGSDSDFDAMLHNAKEIIEDWTDTEILQMDGNNMTFEDNTFDEITSNQCVGIYVTDYASIARILKHGGQINLGVWSSHVALVIARLIEQGIEITAVEWLNGCFDDIKNDDYTLMIRGIKP